MPLWDAVDDDKIAYPANAAQDNIFTGGGTVAYWTIADTGGENNLGQAISKSIDGANSGWYSTIHGESGSDFSMRIAIFFSGSDGHWKPNTNVFTYGDKEHFCATYDDGDVANEPIIYANGVSETISLVAGPPTGTVGDDSSDPIEVYDVPVSTIVNYDGKVAYIGLWNRILTASEVAALARGANPFIFQDSLTFYAPQNTDTATQRNYQTPTDGTITGATSVDGGFSVEPLENFL